MRIFMSLFCWMITCSAFAQQQKAGVELAIPLAPGNYQVMDRAVSPKAYEDKNLPLWLLLKIHAPKAQHISSFRFNQSQLDGDNISQSYFRVHYLYAYLHQVFSRKGFSLRLGPGFESFNSIREVSVPRKEGDQALYTVGEVVLGLHGAASLEYGYLKHRVEIRCRAPLFQLIARPDDHFLYWEAGQFDSYWLNDQNTLAIFQISYRYKLSEKWNIGAFFYNENRHIESDIELRSRNQQLGCYLSINF